MLRKIGIFRWEILCNIIFATFLLRRRSTFQIDDAVMCEVVFHGGVPEVELVCDNNIVMRVCYRFTLATLLIH